MNIILQYLVQSTITHPQESLTIALALALGIAAPLIFGLLPLMFVIGKPSRFTPGCSVFDCGGTGMIGPVLDILILLIYSSLTSFIG